MVAYFEEIVNHVKRAIFNMTGKIEGQITKFYLISANILLAVFAIWLSNVGSLPFVKTGDFAFFVLLALIMAIYRPGWVFVFFIGTIALENINLAPKSLGLMVRPYQLLGLLTILGISAQFLFKRLPFALPKLHWYDCAPIVFAFAGFLSAVGSSDKGLSFKQSVVALSFVALYFLVRVYIQSLDDLKRVAPFFLGSSILIVGYGIWQNIQFLHGKNSFEVMLGRPNGTFMEADWLGMYLVFLLAIVFAIIYKLRNK